MRAVPREVRRRRQGHQALRRRRGAAGVSEPRPRRRLGRRQSGAGRGQLDPVAARVRERAVHPVLGAGVHAPHRRARRFTTRREQRPPIGAGLSRELAGACDFAERVPARGSRQPAAGRAGLRDRALARAARRAVSEAVARRQAAVARCCARSHGWTSRSSSRRTTTSSSRTRCARPASSHACGLHARRSSRRRDYREADAAEPGHLQDPRRHRAAGDARDHRRGLHRVRPADERQGPYDPVPLRLKVYLDRLDDAVRRLQPAGLQPAAAVQDAALEDRQREHPGDVLGRLRAGPLIVDVWQSQRRSEVHRRGRVGVRAAALRAVAGRSLAVAAVTIRRRRPGGPVPRDPAVSLCRHAIFFAREDETCAARGASSRCIAASALRRSGDGKSSLINAGLLPAARRARLQRRRVRVQPRVGEEIVIERIANERTATSAPSSLRRGRRAARGRALERRRSRSACTRRAGRTGRSWSSISSRSW